MTRLLLLAVILVTMLAWPAHAVDGCQEATDLHGSEVTCRKTATEVRDLYATAADDGYTYSLESRCKPGDDCTRDERICRTDAGASGTWSLLTRETDKTGVVVHLGVVCLAPGDMAGLATITPAMVRREMQRLDWPRARLEVQPPDGQTLINFDTIFYTGNTGPTTQTVMLLGQGVRIEASPTEYTWHFGDDASVTTSSPGAAYPGLDVTHDYSASGRVAPSVDTTYTGRYRINGGGWQQIPGSLTVDGEPVALRVRSASPHLVGTG